MDINVESVNPGQLHEILDILYAVKHPALLLGAPGIGKTEVIRQWCAKRGFNLVTRMLSQTVPGDLAIPDIDKKAGVLRQNIIDWLVELPEDKPTVIFLDELTSAQRDVATQAYELLLDRRLGGHQLPEDCYIIAAGNRVTDNASAFQVDTAMADRLTIFNLEPDAKQWLKWASNNDIDPSVLAFIKVRADQLTDEHNFEHLCRRSPRSWKKVSDIIKQVGGNPEQVHTIIQGNIGQDSTIEFIKTLREINDLPKLSTLAKMSDAELAANAPSTLTRLWGLAYSLHAWANNVPRILDAFRIVYVMCDNAALDNKDDIKVAASYLLCYKAFSNTKWLREVVRSDKYKKYFVPLSQELQSMVDSASFVQ